MRKYRANCLALEQAVGVPIAGVAGYRTVEEAKVAAGQRVAIIGAAASTCSSVDPVKAKER
jgi:D-arabinose 1-dehydrogenase-like Zn-dependent alcohol dehydrogenase